MPKTKKHSLAQKRALDRLRKQRKVDPSADKTELPASYDIVPPHISEETLPNVTSTPAPAKQSSPSLGHQVTASLPYNPERLLHLIGDDTSEIPDDIITASLNLMNGHSAIGSNFSIGLYTPAQLHLLSTGSIVVLPPPLNKNIINIHPVTRHWVCSYYKCNTRTLFVYDSLKSNLHLQQVTLQLTSIYGEEITRHLQYADVCQQGSDPICGVLAIAYAFTCFLGGDPATVRYDFAKARNHLRHCLSTAQVLPFPVKDSISCDWLNAYFQDQKNRTQQKLQSLQSQTVLPTSTVTASALRKRKSRQNIKFRLKEKETDKHTKSIIRADPAKKAKLQTVDRTSKQKIRSTPVKRLQHQLKDKHLKQILRADVITQSHLRNIDRTSKQRRRTQPEIRQKHQSNDQQLKAASRADPLTRPHMQALDRSSKQNIRAIPEKRRQHQSADRNFKKALRSDPSTQPHMQALDRTSKSFLRSTPARRQQHQTTDRQLKTALRADPLTRPHMQALDRTSKRLIRSIPERRQQHQAQDKQYKKALRIDPIRQAHLQSIDRISKQTVRAVSSIDQALQQFKQSCSEMPIFTCCVCFRLLFRKQVKICDVLKFPDRQLILRCILVNNMHRTGQCEQDCQLCAKYICFTCNHHLMNNNIPNQASLTHLNLDKLPDCLKTLNALEKHLVSPIIPFMKIVTLPKGSQQGIHGPVVCVPSNIRTTVQTLPRPVTDNTIIAVKLKRKLDYKGHHLYQQVSINKIHQALLYLKGRNPHFSGIDIDLNNISPATETMPLSNELQSTLTDTPLPGHIAETPVPEHNSSPSQTNQSERTSEPYECQHSESIHDINLTNPAPEVDIDYPDEMSSNPSDKKPV